MDKRSRISGVLFDATQLDSWKFRAAGDDVKLGLKHSKKFKKISIFGNKNRPEKAEKIGSWYISGEVKFLENLADTVAYLQEA